MQFLKAHYEKIILSVVLLGLAAAAALMPITVSKERQKQQDLLEIFIPKKVKELQPLDLTTNAMVLARLAQAQRLQLAGDHNLFNPVRWQTRPTDKGLIKTAEAGVAALAVSEITPLRLRVEFDQVVTTSEEPKYMLQVLNEVQRSSRPTPRTAGVGDKNNMFSIEKIIGDNPAEPKGLQVLLAGDKQPVIIAKDQPYERVIGYAAALRHKVEDKTWKDLKVKDEISFGGETYNIVAITENEVVLSAKSNKKQTVLEFKPPQR